VFITLQPRLRGVNASLPDLALSSEEPITAP